MNLQRNLSTAPPPIPPKRNTQSACIRKHRLPASQTKSDQVRAQVRARAVQSRYPMALRLVALLVLAPALDFLPRDKVPSAYFDAVTALQSIEVCKVTPPRHTGVSAGYDAFHLIGPGLVALHDLLHVALELC